MSIEKASTIAELVPTNPTIQDPVHNAPDHFWLLKNVLKNQFPGKAGNGLVSPLAASEDEFNFLVGVRRGIQEQIDDLAAGASDSAFAKGTTLVFAQPLAPTGYEQVTSDVDNRMMRVVSTNGGGMGGTDDPTSCNILPAHTHTFTTGQGGAHQHGVTVQNADASHSHGVSISAASTDHTHSFQTSPASIDHTHGFSGRTNGATANHTHGTHALVGQGGYSFGGGSQTVGNHQMSGMDQDHQHDFSGNTQSGGGSHSHSGSTGGMSGGSSHTHGGQASAANATHNHQASTDLSQNHTHSGATDKTGQEGGWLPRYIDVIIARKVK